MGKAQISQASIDENGNIKGGIPGDQTGKETNVKNWYSGSNGGWDEVIRCKNEDVARKAAECMVKLVDSNLVGYNQNRRNTLYNALEKCDWSVDKYIISGQKTETDCSAFVFASYCCAIPNLRKLVKQNGYFNSPTCSTSWFVYSKCKDDSGNDMFERYTDPALIKSQDNLLVGDLLNSIGHHIVMVCSTDGSVKLSNIPPASGDVVYTNQTSYSGDGGRISSVRGNAINAVKKWTMTNKTRGLRKGIVLGANIRQK